MNFTTDLPKTNPQVKYLVATGKHRNDWFRMHVVVLASQYDRRTTLTQVSEIMETPDKYRLILCHTLKLGKGTSKKASVKHKRYLK